MIDIETWRSRIGRHKTPVGLRQIEKMAGYNPNTKWTTAMDFNYRMTCIALVLCILATSSLCLQIPIDCETFYNGSNVPKIATLNNDIVNKDYVCSFKTNLCVLHEVYLSHGARVIDLTVHGDIETNPGPPKPEINSDQYKCILEEIQSFRDDMSCIMSVMKTLIRSLNDTMGQMRESLTEIRENQEILRLDVDALREKCSSETKEQPQEEIERQEGYSRRDNVYFNRKDSNHTLVEKMDVEQQNNINMPTDLGEADHLNSGPEKEFDIYGQHYERAEVTVKQDDEGATGGDVEPDNVNIDHSPFPVNNNEANTDKDTPKETTMVPTSGVSPVQTIPPSERSNYQNVQKFALQNRIPLDPTITTCKELQLTNRLPQSSFGDVFTASHGGETVAIKRMLGKLSPLPSVEVTDCGDDESDGHKPPVAVSNSEASVSSDYPDNDDRKLRLKLNKAIQDFPLEKKMSPLSCVEVTDFGDDEPDGDKPPVAVSCSEASVSSDYPDNDDKKEFNKDLTSEQQKLFKSLVDDVVKGKSELVFNDRKGKVILKDISDTSRYASKPPEYTLKVTSVAGKKDDKKSVEVNEFCNRLDDLKNKRSSSGVALSDKMGISSSKRYEEGQQYKVPKKECDRILGEGLNGKVTVIKDVKTGDYLAKKRVAIHTCNSDEIRAMYDLREAGICPELYGIKLDSCIVIIFMEIVNNCKTVKGAIEQLAGSKDESFHIALFVLTKLMEALDTMHNQYHWYHQDMHIDNVLIEKVGSQYRIRIIDFGNAKHLTDLKKNEYFQRLISLDLQNVLRQFCALALQRDCFEDIYDFKENYESIVKNAETGHKNQINEIIKEGLAVKFQKESNYIEFLKSKCNAVVSEDIITTGLKCLSLDREENPELAARFTDLHDQSKSVPK